MDRGDDMDDATGNGGSSSAAAAAAVRGSGSSSSSRGQLQPDQDRMPLHPDHGKTVKIEDDSDQEIVKVEQDDSDKEIVKDEPSKRARDGVFPYP